MFCVIHEELVYIFQIEDFGEIFATVITIEFKAFLMKNFYTHFEIAYSSKIFATLITIESFFYEQLCEIFATLITLLKKH